MKKKNTKELVETQQIHKKVFQIVDSKKEVKTFSTKAIKAMLYSLAILLTFSAVNTSVSASESEENIKSSEKIAEFNSEKEFKKLLEKYPIFDKQGVRITESKNHFSDVYRPPLLSWKENWYLNNDQYPKTKFRFDKTGYDFSTKFSKSNQLKKQIIGYNEGLPSEFVNSKIYEQLESKIKVKGYFIENKNGTYHAVIMHYQIEDDYLQTTFSTVGEFDESDNAISNFEIKNMKTTKNKSKSVTKKEKAAVKKRNTYIKAVALVVASSAVTATIFKLKNKQTKSGEDENE